MTTGDIKGYLQSLSDAELASRATSGALTPEAQLLAEQEVATRGLAISVSATPPEQTDREYEGDMTVVAKYLTPTEAHMLCSCLNAAGIPADAGDTNLVQAHSLLSVAVGGARVRVPGSYESEARAVIAAYNRGEFALDEDFDPDAPPPDATAS